METTRKIWNKFKTQPDVWFFYGFLLTFTLSIRKVLYFYPIQRSFNEYTGAYLYLSDIFLFLTFFSCLFKLYNKYYLLSRSSSGSLFYSLIGYFKKIWEKNNLLFLFPLLLVIWSLISISWAENRNIALFRSLKLLEFYLLFIYVAFRIVPRGTIFRNILKIIIFLGVFHSIVGIWQFIAQHSIGFFWLKESLVSPNIPGVAKIVFHGEKFIRAYGLFPHPNILAGFLILSIIFTILYCKLFHVEQFKAKGRINCSTWNNFFENMSLNVPRGTIILRLLLFIQIIGIILSMSKSAITGLIIALLMVKVNDLNVPRETFNNKWLINLFKNRGFQRFILISSILFMAFLIIKPDLNTFLFQSSRERLFYLNVSRGTILDNLLIGVGSGQFVLNMQNYITEILQSWQFQPVHNVFLLIWSELGLIGLVLFVWFLVKLFHVEQFKAKGRIKCSTWNIFFENMSLIVPRGTIASNQVTNLYLKATLVSFIFIMLLDHYLWDIQQGQAIFWLVSGFLASFQLQNQECFPPNPK